MNQLTRGVRELTAAELLPVSGGATDTITEEQAAALVECIGGITAEEMNVNTACLTVMGATAPGRDPVPQPPESQAPPPNIMGDPQPGGGGGSPDPMGSGTPSSGGGGGSGGESCVHVDSRLPDGRRAGDLKVGDTIQLGEEGTLQSRVGLVTYSKSNTQRGYRITTQSGISLLCSDTAPICTDHGFVLAPDLLGKKVATRVDGKDIVTRFETVEVLAEVGLIEVQHITVGDRAFWAGASHGQYILHHNKYVSEDEE